MDEFSTFDQNEIGTNRCEKQTCDHQTTSNTDLRTDHSHFLYQPCGTSERTKRSEQRHLSQHGPAGRTIEIIPFQIDPSNCKFLLPNVGRLSRRKNIAISYSHQHHYLRVMHQCSRRSFRFFFTFLSICLSDFSTFFCRSFFSQ